MRKFTEKQQKFIDAKIAGMKNAPAAVAAGFAPNSAGVAASKLMSRADVKAAVAKGKRSAGKEVSIEDGLKKLFEMQREEYSDPADFLRDAMNNPMFPPALRLDAAKQLMPYQHARIGEKGKKEKRNDDASGVVKSSKFAPKAQPRLASVTPIRR